MRQIIAKLAAHCPVAIVSGRGLRDVRARVGLDQLYYAGSHGFDIAGPGGLRREHPAGSRLLPEIERAQKALGKRLASIDGCRVERKKFALAVHYREVAAEDVPSVERVVQAIHQEVSGLRLSGGKKIFELQPDVDWHKGRAVRWLLEDALDLDCSAVMPVYIGDDVTDEDAFREIRNDGIGIRVDETAAGDSAARYRLRDPREVRQFLLKLADRLQQTADLSAWRLVYTGFKPQEEKLREALCTLGNGYFATRGAGPESEDDGCHYPGTYLAGGYNRLKTEKVGRIIENEDLVNMPNWLPLNFRFDQGAWFDLSKVDVLQYCQELDIRNGVLLRTIRFSDDRRRITRLIERRFVHMRHAHLAGLETKLIAENWSGRVEFRTALDGRIVNNGVERYRNLSNRHLTALETGQPADDAIFLKMQTNQSELRLALAARTQVFSEDAPVSPERRTLQETGFVAQLFEVPIEINEAVRVEKIVSFYSSRDPAISECSLAARTAVRTAGPFHSLLQSHTRAWEASLAALRHRAGKPPPPARKPHRHDRPSIYFSSAAVHLHQHHVHGSGCRGSLARLARRSLPRTYLLGRTVHFSHDQSAAAGDYARAAHVPLSTPGCRAGKCPSGRLPRRHVSLAKRQRRARGKPASAPQSAIRPLDPGQKSPAAARQCRHCL